MPFVWGPPAKSLLNGAAMVPELGKGWTEESQYREELALLRERDCLHLAGTIVRQVMKAGGENDWSKL